MDKEFTNFAFTYLDEPLPATTLQGNLRVADGSNFPTGKCTIVIHPANEQPTKENAEIININNRVGNNLILQYDGRGQQGTTIKNHVAGANVILSLTAKDITEIFEQINDWLLAIDSHRTDTNNPHGVKAAQISEYGVPELNSEGIIPNIYLPSYVDDVLEFDNFSQFPNPGEVGKIYVAKDTNITYRWAGTIYVEISSSIALGETSSTAYRGDRGKIAYDHSQITTGNPHNVTIEDIGLGNVDNTSDLDKPVSIATQAALNTKQDSLVSGMNIKTVNNNSLLGNGDITISGGNSSPIVETIVVHTISYVQYKVGVSASGNYTPKGGDIVRVNFVNGCAIDNAKLKIDDGVSYPIYLGNSYTRSTTFDLGSIANSNVGVLLWFDDNRNVWVVFGSTQNTIYPEITEAEITAGLSLYPRAISGRRSKFLINRALRHTLTDGWIDISGCTRNGELSITLPSNTTSLIELGDKIKVATTSLVYTYYYVVYKTGNVIMLKGDSGIEGNFSDPVYVSVSKQENPVGFPHWFDWIPLGGNQNNVVLNFSSGSAKFKIAGKTCYWWLKYNCSFTNTQGGFARMTLPLESQDTQAVYSNIGMGDIYNNNGPYNKVVIVNKHPNVPQTALLFKPGGENFVLGSNMSLSLSGFYQCF